MEIHQSQELMGNDRQPRTAGLELSRAGPRAGHIPSLPCRLCGHHTDRSMSVPGGRRWGSLSAGRPTTPRRDRGYGPTQEEIPGRKVVNISPRGSMRQQRLTGVAADLLGRSPGLAGGRPLSGQVRGTWRWQGAVWMALRVAVILAVMLPLQPALALHPSRADSVHVNGNNGQLTDEGDDAQSSDGTRSQVTGTDFLMMFGYLPQSDIETGALRTEEEMTRAIRRFQSYAQLPATGKLDQVTREQMVKPRCGLPDMIPQYNNRDSSGRSRRIRSWNNGLMMDARRRRRRHGHGQRSARYALAGVQWEKRHLTFRILNYSPDLSQSQVRDAVYRAFKVWSEVTFLTFTERMYGHADMMIRFARGYHDDGYPFDGRGLILAHAFFPGVDRGGDVHFDDDEDWTMGKHEGTNLFIVAAHEIGHALGLSHSSVPGSLMFPWYQGYTPNFVLHTDDIVGIQYMYGAKPFTPFDRRPSTIAPGHDGKSPLTPAVDNVPSTHSTEPTSTFTMPAITKEITTVTPAPTASDQDSAPDVCTAVLDAISIIRGEIFAFSGKWFWRVDDKGVMAGYPVKINRFWYGFPSAVDRIDAVFERPGDGKIVFFRGPRYWMFNGNHPIANFPAEGEPLTNLGLPESVQYIDTAFQWGHNKRIYFIYKDRYWRFNEHDGEVDYDYPRAMEMWGGVHVPVAAAFQFWDGRTYFFQGTKTWAFNDARMHVRSNYPKHIGETFLGCKRQMKQGFDFDNPHVSDGGQGSLQAHLITVAAMIVVLHIAS